jgi:hypothetical protein
MDAPRHLCQVQHHDTAARSKAKGKRQKEMCGFPLPLAYLADFANFLTIFFRQSIQIWIWSEIPACSLVGIGQAQSP